MKLLIKKEHERVVGGIRAATWTLWLQGRLWASQQIKVRKKSKQIVVHLLFLSVVERLKMKILRTISMFGTSGVAPHKTMQYI